MLDKLMLQDIKNILKKLQIIKSNPEYQELLTKCSAEAVHNGEELDLVIVRKFMGEKEENLFSRYLTYKKAQNLANAKKCLTSLSDVTAQIDGLYSTRNRGAFYIDENKKHIIKLNGKIDELNDAALVSLIDDVNHYRQEFTTANSEYRKRMSSFKHKLKRLNSSKPLFPFIKDFRIKRTTESMNRYKRRTGSILQNKKRRYDMYTEEFESHLETFCKDELLSDKDLLEAIIFILMENPSNELLKYEKGVRRLSLDYQVDFNLLLEETKNFIRHLIIENPNTWDFKRSLKANLIKIFQEDIKKIADKRNACLLEISKQFKKQGKIMGELRTYQKVLPEPEPFTQDEEDTLSVVYYTDLGKNHLHN